MKLKQKIFDFYIKRLNKTCLNYYKVLEYSEKDLKDIKVKRRCEGCPYEYQTIDGNYSCYVMKHLRKYVNYTPAFWFNKKHDSEE